jgi:F-type H+-transporting ATPase subunit b
MESLGVNGFAILLHAINFLVLLFLLQRFLYKPVMTMLDQRAATIRESVEAAERARQESARADQERLEALREARRQAEEIVTRAQQEADRIRSERLAQTQEEAQRIIARAQEEATAERQQAMQELRAQVADLAVLAAGRVINRNLDPQAHRAPVEEFLAEGDGPSGDGRAGGAPR